MFDSSQEGTQALNTTFNGFDDTIKAPAIQAIQVAIQSIEEQVSSITGVLTQALGNIQQRDAVSNVKVGVRQSTLLTKQYFSAMDLMYKEVNYDLLNCAKVVYKKGLKGTLILGDKLIKVFNALPEYYTMTDFDIHIQDSTETFQDKESLKATSVELIKSGQVDPTMIFNIMTAKNVGELKEYIEDAVQSKKQENDIVAQLQQQLQQMQQQAQQLQQQLQQATQQNEKLQKELEKNSSDKLQLEQQRVEIEKKKADDTKSYNDRIATIKEREVDIEYMQLSDGNPYNDKIKNS